MGAPCSPMACTGEVGDSRRLPGLSSLRSPGISVHQWCPLFIAMPVRPITTPDPYEDPRVCVILTASPLSSAAARCVVDRSGALRARRILPPRRRAAMRRRAPVRSARSLRALRACRDRPRTPSSRRVTSARSSWMRSSLSIHDSGTSTNSGSATCAAASIRASRIASATSAT